MSLTYNHILYRHSCKLVIVSVVQLTWILQNMRLAENGTGREETVLAEAAIL